MNEPAPEPVSLLIELESILHPLDVNKYFARPAPLEVELGSGDGSFLARYAAACPDRNFIGLERLLGRLRKLDRKGRRAGLTNLRVARIEAAYFLEFLLPKNSASAVHVYFPDPWPKRRHHKNRLVNERFPLLARAALVPGGTVYLRTDDADYFAQMECVFQACEFFAPVPTPPALSAIMTDFERGFAARGVGTLRSAWKIK